MADAKVFLVTGASGGIGAATARAAHAVGYRLVLAARRTDALEELATELGSDVLVVAADVTEWADNERLAAAALERFGRIDVVFANAGFGAKRGLSNAGDTPEHWRAMVLTNVLGVAYTARACLDAVVSTKGQLVLTGSVAGRIAVPGSLYSATKWAVTGLGQSLRGEVAGTGVRVTVIEPGYTDTAFYEEPPAHALEVEDVANAVMWAVSQPPHVDVNELLVRPVGQTA